MLSSKEIEVFRRICSSFGINLSDEMVDKFQAYNALLLQWNQRMHLVSKRDAEPHRIVRHFVDSLTIFKAVDIPKGAKLLDLGSGAGFPGVPIKIVRDDIRLTLVESIHKKTLFLRKLIRNLGLEGISIQNLRAEELLEKPNLEGYFSLVTAKAVGRLADEARLGVPLLKTGGVLVAYKGKRVRGELEKTSQFPQCRIKEVARVESLEMDLERCLILIERIR